MVSKSVLLTTLVWRVEKSYHLQSSCSQYMWPWSTKPVIWIYTSSESWINKLSIDVWFVRIGQYLKIWNLRVQKNNQNTEKIAFKVIQMRSLATHITNQKLSCDTFTISLHGTWSLLNILMIVCRKEKLIILTHTIFLLAIATNIPVRLETGFVVQGHIFLYVSNILCIAVHLLYHEILAKYIKQQILSSHIATINVISCKLMKT